ncbi:MAG TPA: FtsX-like permease family protein, partial [Vicinamibacterales bacterium]|nr:FtsX-like permease family protein [Vicinamibacterales bacterium]
RTQAEAQFAAIARQFSEPVDAASTSGILPLQELLVGDVRRPLQVFAAAAVFVLLIACGNVANLLLARGSVRQREIAIRSALGASRGRMIRQLLTESLLVSLAGAAGGLALAARGVPAMIALVPADSIPRVDEIHIHTGVAAFAIAISVAASVVFGMGPAFRLTRRASVSLAPGMGRHMPEQERLRSTLVVAEIALALVLLTGAGLLLQSFLRLRSIDTGFRPRNVMTMTVDLPLTVYSTADQMKTFHQALLEQLSRGQGVVQTGAVNWRPLGTMLITGDFQAAGSPVSEDVRVVKGAVSPGYFSTMGIRLLRGREFTSDDDRSGPGVAIVSRSVARMLEPSGNAIGRRVALSTPAGPQDWLAVVGVVDDIRQVGPAQEPHPAIYQPYLQVQQPVFLSHMTFAVRTTSDPMSVTPALRAALGEVDRNQPAGPIVLMEDVLAAATAEPRFNARLLGTFALLALLLALVGTYGVLAYAVAQRTHEIGVRMALGAQARALRWAVIRRTLLLSGAGVLLGTGGALLSTRLLSALLFDIEPTDPKTFSLVALLILLTALASGYVPARRATRVDPVLALRHE